LNRVQLIKQLEAYRSFDKSEEAMRLRMLEFISSYKDCFKREWLTGHVTSSCWVVNTTFDQVLLLHHVKLNRWLQPGGHCDGNENVFEVAQNELLEETGLANSKSSGAIFDLDIHTIPERKGIPEHEHFDVRFLFVADDLNPLTKNHETNALAWIEIDRLEELTAEPGILRMRSKTIR
jgi:8-oxo-dGTP pyrophosphatase MutT (NUDIX family)